MHGYTQFFIRDDDRRGSKTGFCEEGVAYRTGLTHRSTKTGTVLFQGHRAGGVGHLLEQVYWVHNLQGVVIILGAGSQSRWGHGGGALLGAGGEKNYPDCRSHRCQKTGATLLHDLNHKRHFLIELGRFTIQIRDDDSKSPFLLILILSLVRFESITRNGESRFAKYVESPQLYFLNFSNLTSSDQM